MLLGNINLFKTTLLGVIFAYLPYPNGYVYNIRTVSAKCKYEGSFEALSLLVSVDLLV